MAFLSPKKLKKLKENPTAFFVDAFNKKAFPIKNALKKLKPKKYQGFSKYAIVSAVYNVEKYLDDYFKSILNQRLDFKNNILIICVDDGSTDNSAKIIKKYQKKYPQNIFYLYKENGGQASARNLGLEFLKKIMENDGQGLNDSLQSSECIRKAGQGLENINSNLSSADDEQNHSGLLRYARNDEKESNEQKSEFKKFDDNQQNDDKNNNGLPRRHFVSPRNDGIDDKSHLIDNTDKFPENSPKFSNISWVTFTDPDDFLDRDYFYEVDRFLRKNKDRDLALVACPVVLYYEKNKTYNKELGLFPIYNEGKRVVSNRFLGDDLAYVASSNIFYLKYVRTGVNFPQEMKICSEDVVFVTHFLLDNEDKAMGVLPSAKYYYRQRGDNSSSLNLSSKKKGTYLDLFEYGYLQLLFEKSLKDKGLIPDFVQKSVINTVAWNLTNFIDKPNVLNSVLNAEEKQKHLKLMDKIFSYIDEDVLRSFFYTWMYDFHHTGLLYTFKHIATYPHHPFIFIKKYIPHKNQILLAYFTGNAKDDKKIFIDNQEIKVDLEKISCFYYFDRVFVYEKLFYITLDFRQYSHLLKIFVEGKEAFRVKMKHLQEQLQGIRLKKAKIKDNWLLIDSFEKAGNNAEVLYEYIQKNHPQINIYFALDKNSPDYERLAKKGFKLIDSCSFQFKDFIKTCGKLIFSHPKILEDTRVKDYKTKDLIYLQAGVNIYNTANLMRHKNIDLMCVCNEKEYKNIVQDFNKYELSKEEVKLLGLARFDKLKSLNGQSLNHKNEKLLLLCPSYRRNLNVQSISAQKFVQSEFFKNWNVFLNHEELAYLAEEFSFKLVLCLDASMFEFSHNFNLPTFASYGDYFNIENLISQACVLITDYSTYSFDMAFLNKSTLYYQFDKEDVFYNEDNYSFELDEAFDIEKDGFGKVAYDIKSLIENLRDFLTSKNLNEKYLKNIQKALYYRDKNNCQRIIEAIFEIDEETK